MKISKLLRYLSVLFFNALILIAIIDCEKDITKVKPDKTQPTIKNGITITDLSFDSTIIQWITDEPCSVFVKYWTEDKDTMQKLGEQYRQRHEVTLTDLQPQTKYYFKAISIDLNNNKTVSNDSTFTTLEDYTGYISKGWDKFKKENYIESVKYFRDYAEFKSESFKAQLGLGWSYLGIGKIDSARRYFSSGRQQKPLNKDILSGLAIANYRDSIFYQSINYAQKVIPMEDSTINELKNLYEFEKDSSLKGPDIALIMADSYIQTLQYENTWDVLNILLPGDSLALNPETQTEEIENKVDSLKSNWWKDLKYLPNRE